MKSAPSQEFVEMMAVVVTILGTGMVYLDQTAVNVALPRLQVALNADVGGLQWLIDIYILTLGVLLLIGGALGDMYGRVRVFVIGMVIFVLSSAACGLANSLDALIAARAVQGVGGALLVPGGLAMINAVVAEERRGRALGTWGTFSPLVTVSGPVVGGWLVDNVTWRAVFFLNIPVGLAAGYVALRYVPETRDENASRALDLPGVATLMIGLAGLLFGLIEGPHLGWGSPLVAACLAAGVAGLAAFVVVEWRSPAPLLPLGLFRNRSFTGINLMTLVLYFAMGNLFFFLTLNLQQVQGYTAFEAGLAQLPTALALFLLAGRVGRLTDRVGPVPLMTAGGLVACLGVYLYTLPGVGGSYWTTFFLPSVVFGSGMVTVFIPLTAVALGSLPSRYSGIASGFNNAVTRVAMMMAVAIFGALMTDGFRAGLAERTAALPLSDGVRADLLARARELGATLPPAGLAADVTAAVRQAIQWAFVDAFRLNMFVALGLALLSLVIMLATVRYQPAARTKEAGAAVISAD
jgi:EmrB/QacA subfamily drug resistance transporter